MIQVQTSQNITIQYQTASISDRIFAFLIDVLIQTVASIAFLLILSKLRVNFGFENGMMAVWILTFLPIFLYPLLTEFFFDGQTLGKRVRKIKVVKLDGSQANLGNYLLRWILGIVELYTFQGAIALLVLLINPRGQRLGDMAAGTTVVKLQKPISLDDTIFQSINKDYTPTFLEVTKLSDHDISVMREVMQVVGQLDNASELQQKTREAILRKTGIETYMPNGKLFETIIKDYNHLTGKLDA
jgi:uncharacterized RDD family membrane protein YckC